MIISEDNLVLFYAKDEYEWPFACFFEEENFNNFQIDWKEFQMSELCYNRKKPFLVPIPSNAEQLCMNEYGENWNKIIIVAQGHSILHDRRIKSSIDYVYDIVTGDLISHVDEKAIIDEYLNKNN
ncbi:unnamed protein product [Brachionus calyciflorus]|uniref:Uncharacterized protein n=1 Tax=Brachionus calyciflorus TaxID=104777 RepID=A0A813XLT5_9BILA|nr:unnamed protein product [Brachionus calyciflorus]